MKADFWLSRWEEGRIGFHQDVVHADLHTHQDRFLGGGPHRVLVPLCGKSRDLAWMAEQGHRVVGVELSSRAAQQLFDDAGCSPTITAAGDLQRWQAGNLTVYVGDLFQLHADMIGPFDRIWDRAALVALPPEMRTPYTALLRTLLRPGGLMLLNCFRHDLQREGPPHAVPEHEVFEHYGNTGELVLLSAQDIIEEEGRWHDMGATVFVVTTWLLRQGSGQA